MNISGATTGQDFLLRQLNALESASARNEQALATQSRILGPGDDPVDLLRSMRLREQSEHFEERLAPHQQAVQSVKAADLGISAVTEVLNFLRSTVDEAVTMRDAEARRTLGQQFNEMLRQVGQLASDASYAGTNLLQRGDGATTDDRLVLPFSEGAGQSSLVIEGLHLAGPQVIDAATGETSVGLVLSSSNGRFEAIEIPPAGQTASIALDWGGRDYLSELTALSNALGELENTLEGEQRRLGGSTASIVRRSEALSAGVLHYDAAAGRLIEADLDAEAAEALSLRTARELTLRALQSTTEQTQHLFRAFL